MIVRFSAEAEADLEHIADHIAQDNPRRALTFVQELRAACLGLAEFPERFTLVARYAERGIRHRVETLLREVEAGRGGADEHRDQRQHRVAERQDEVGVER